MYPLELPGQKVMLRDFRPDDDAAAALRVVGDDTVTRWLSFDSRDLAGAQAMIDGAIERARQQPRTEFYLAVVLPGDELIGFARLALTGAQAAKLGYAIQADRWGHGYALDATRTLVDFGFTELKLHRISAAIGPDNAASIKVAERLGMRPEGRIRDHVFTNGAWRDSVLYAVLADEGPQCSAS